MSEPSGVPDLDAEGVHFPPRADHDLAQQQEQDSRLGTAIDFALLLGDDLMATLARRKICTTAIRVMLNKCEESYRALTDDGSHTYRIHQPCEECSRTGRWEIQTGSASYRSTICPTCSGRGYQIFTEVGYDSEREVAEDYPDALSISQE